MPRARFTIDVAIDDIDDCLRGNFGRFSDRDARGALDVLPLLDGEEVPDMPRILSSLLRNYVVYSCDIMSHNIATSAFKFVERLK